MDEERESGGGGLHEAEKAAVVMFTVFKTRLSSKHEIYVLVQKGQQQLGNSLYSFEMDMQ